MLYQVTVLSNWSCSWANQKLPSFEARDCRLVSLVTSFFPLFSGKLEERMRKGLTRLTGLQTINVTCLGVFLEGEVGGTVDGLVLGEGNIILF